MADRTPPPKRDFSWGKISKTLSLWIIVILIPIVFMQVNGTRDQTTEIDYSTYSQQLDQDNALLSQVSRELSEGVPAPMQPLLVSGSGASSSVTNKQIVKR